MTDTRGFDSHQLSTGAMKRDPGGTVNDTGWISRMQQRFPILGKKRGKALALLILCLPLLGLLGLLALRNGGGNGTPSGGTGSGNTSGPLTDDTYFYGQSEPVYPSRRSRSMKLRV
jgi:beta-glucosidase